MSQPTLNSRDVYQILRDIALGVRSLHPLGVKRWSQVGHGEVLLDADGWQLALHSDDGRLDYCAACQAPDGRVYRFDGSQRFGTDPVELLSTWEQQQVQQRLDSL